MKEAWKVLDPENQVLKDSCHGNNSICINNVGGEEMIKPLDADLWLHAMIHESCKPPDFYSAEFKHTCDDLLFELMGMTQASITADNGREVYITLLQNFDD